MWICELVLLCLIESAAFGNENVKKPVVYSYSRSALPHPATITHHYRQPVEQEVPASTQTPAVYAVPTSRGGLSLNTEPTYHRSDYNGEVINVGYEHTTHTLPPPVYDSQYVPLLSNHNGNLDIRSAYTFPQSSPAYQNPNVGVSGYSNGPTHIPQQANYQQNLEYNNNLPPGTVEYAPIDSPDYKYTYHTSVSPPHVEGDRHEEYDYSTPHPGHPTIHTTSTYYDDNVNYNLKNLENTLLPPTVNTYHNDSYSNPNYGQTGNTHSSVQHFSGDSGGGSEVSKVSLEVGVKGDSRNMNPHSSHQEVHTPLVSVDYSPGSPVNHDHEEPSSQTVQDYQDSFDKGQDYQNSHGEKPQNYQDYDKQNQDYQEAYDNLGQKYPGSYGQKVSTEPPNYEHDYDHDTIYSSTTQIPEIEPLGGDLDYPSPVPGFISKPLQHHFVTPNVKGSHGLGEVHQNVGKVLQLPKFFAYSSDLDGDKQAVDALNVDVEDVDYEEPPHNSHISSHPKKKKDEKHAKGGGQEHHSAHKASGGHKGDKGYKSFHEHSNGKKGHHDKEEYKKAYKDEKGKKGKKKVEGGHYGEHHKAEKGKKAAAYKESGEHKKGHSTKGEHNIHKKDEYLKKYEFYDEHHEGGEHEKEGGFAEEHARKKGGKKKKGHHKSGKHEHHKGKKGHRSKGHKVDHHKGHKAAKGYDGHFANHKKFGKKGGHKEAKIWGYDSGHPSHDYRDEEYRDEDYRDEEYRDEDYRDDGR